MAFTVIFVSLLLFWTMVQAQQQVLGPKLHPMLDEHVVPVGQFWRVTCKGHLPIEWEYPSVKGSEAGDDIQDRLSVVHERVPGNNPRPYLAHLELRSLTYLDTGLYRCRHIGSESEVTETYLYAQDPEHLIDYPSWLPLVNVVQYEEAVIPCRPTDPNVTMSFFKDDESLEAMMEMMFFRYDPQRGLIIESGSLAFHTGTIVCKAQLGDVNQTYQFYLRFVEAPGPVLPTPFILHPNPLHPVVGSVLNLQCQVNFHTATPHVDLEWSFPNKQWRNDVDRGRIRVDNLTKSIDIGSAFTITKVVSISPVEKEDEGNYTCVTVHTTSGMTSKVETYTLDYIRQHEREPYIGKVVFQGHPLIDRSEVHRDKPIQWVFNVFATPDPTFVWFHPSGEELHYTQLEKYKMDVNTSTGTVKLKINNIVLEDMGQYMFRIEVKGDNGTVASHDVDMFLTFKTDPVTSLYSSDDQKDEDALYTAGQNYTLVCHISGYPINEQSLEWTFQPCQGYYNCGSESTIEHFNNHLTATDGVQNANLHYQFESHLPIVANASGKYSCQVCNTVLDNRRDPRCHKSTLELFVTDYPPGFTIVDPPDDQNAIIEGDSIDLTCAASTYRYDKVVWFKVQRLTEPSIEDKKWARVDMHEGMMTLINHTSKYSHVAKIRFQNVTMADGVDYQCRAVWKNDSMDVDVQEVHLPVQKPVAPSITKTFNMNGTHYTFEHGKPLKFDCSAQGRPWPRITWTKDGKPFPTQDMWKSNTVSMSPDNSTVELITLPIYSGNYECTMANRANTIKGKAKLTVKEDSSLTTALIAGIVCGVIIVVVLAIILIWRVVVYNEKYKLLSAHELKKFEMGDPDSINPEMGVDDQADLLPYNKNYEFPRHSLKLGKQLGCGAFGRVVKAQAFGLYDSERATTVAVKMVKPNADVMYIKALMAELKIMIHLGKHINILNLLGACTKGLARRELYVIVEYCRFGNLQKYLLHHRHTYISQIDANTGEVDFSIGQDIINNSYGNNLPRAREEDELSAVYANRTPETTAAPQMDVEGGYLTPNNRQPDTTTDNARTPPRGGRIKSVRYVTNPGNQRARQESTNSDYLDRIVMTDMTTLTEDDDDRSSRRGVSRTQSTASHGSQGGGPGWRANFRGDYDVSSVKPLATKDLLCWAYQVTRGMEYLASKKVMHGDLACRNILLAADNVVKICDFGLAKDIYKNNTYKKKSDTPLPVKWMAIESLRDRVFSTQSDVWAFGIVLWEMFTLGKTPYPGIEAGERLFEMILSGHRMDKPELCPHSIYDMMKDTWQEDPNGRPTFVELMDRLGGLLEEGERDHYLDMTQQFETTNVCYAERQPVTAVENRNYLNMMSAPDYNQQMSVCPVGDSVEDISPRPLEDENNGYLAANKKHDVVIHNLSVDTNDYLIPTKKGSSEKSADPLESVPMLPAKDTGNNLLVATS